MNAHTLFSENETDYIPERDESCISIKYNDNSSYEDKKQLDVDSETESVCIEGKDLPATSCVFSLVEESSYQNDLIDELHDKILLLEENVHEADTRCQNLTEEKEKLISQLHTEQQKSVGLQKKLKYIQDNQEIFNKLKKAYLNVKYNEAAGRPLIQIDEKGCQADALPIEKSCKNSRNEISVKISDIEDIQTTISNIKSMVNAQRKLQSENSVSQLEEVVKNKDKEINELIKRNSALLKEINTKESTVMKRIILKLEKRQREIEIEHNLQYLPSPLNERERNVVQQIITKCTKRVGRGKEIPSKSSKLRMEYAESKSNGYDDLEIGRGEKIQSETNHISASSGQAKSKTIKKSNLVITQHNKS